jgi:hypothetical protein
MRLKKKKKLMRALSLAGLFMCVCVCLYGMHACSIDSITNLINFLPSHTLSLSLASSTVSKDKGLIIHISATKLRLLEIADEIGFTKPTRSGMRNFNIGSLDDFIFDSTYMTF